MTERKNQPTSGRLTLHESWDLVRSFLSRGQTLPHEDWQHEAALVLLDGLGCDNGQGFHIARPMPADRFWAYLSTAGSAAGTHLSG